jgi:hypothetical protein
MSCINILFDVALASSIEHPTHACGISSAYADDMVKVPTAVKTASSANDVRLFILLRFEPVSIYVYLKNEKRCDF